MTTMNTQTSDAEAIHPRQGVVTLYGYGIGVRLDHGHLAIEDGIGESRRKVRLPRVGHGLKRLVVIGADGMVSLAALRWLADQDAAFVMLDRDGSVLSTTGPVRSSDARLRRAQALAHHSGAALEIARELIDQKLAAQEQVATNKLHNSRAAEIVAQSRASLAAAPSIEAVRLCESRGAAAYWSAWNGLLISFPKKDLSRVPDHWRTFDTRKSPLSGSPRLAANPVNAMLNYLYSLLESEARLAAAALGLDPGFGFLHSDAHARDSLACDLMEPVRPKVDAFVLDWVTREPLKREWFFEKRDGNCRLMGEFTARLSETSPTWGQAVASFAERVTRILWLTTPESNRHTAPATRLTQNRRRNAKGNGSTPPVERAPRPESICRECGNPITSGQRYCGFCAVEKSTKQFADAAQAGRMAAQTPEAQARRASAQHRHANARQGWLASRSLS